MRIILNLLIFLSAYQTVAAEATRFSGKASDDSKFILELANDGQEVTGFSYFEKADNQAWGTEKLRVRDDVLYNITLKKMPTCTACHRHIDGNYEDPVKELFIPLPKKDERKLRFYQTGGYYNNITGHYLPREYRIVVTKVNADGTKKDVVYDVKGT